MAAQEAEFEDEEIVTDEKHVAENDLKKLRDSHFKAGIREGIMAGTQVTLQDGFNWGYRDAFFIAHHFGKVRGVLSAVLSYVSLHNKGQNCEKDNYEDRLKNLLSQLDKIEENISKTTRDTSRSPPSENVRDSKMGVKGHSGADGNDCPTTVVDTPEFKQLFIQYKQLCNELSLDPDAVGITSYVS
ncbi:protein YAE1 homolog [Dendronephthya gigantea]|uniref:protein YAE1 homolog n=1 Tax=Dendronephthya gigantea TaxID=151771 RepID=UPI00106BD1ED|nr:protein YAE1 homolog [Dendronephthya gigantea]